MLARGPPVVARFVVARLVTPALTVQRVERPQKRVTIAHFAHLSDRLPLFDAERIGRLWNIGDRLKLYI